MSSFDHSLDAIIGFCGAGGTGKTSTLDVFAHRNPQFKVIRSQSRATFAKFGVAKEEDQHQMSPYQRWELQKEIQSAHWDYMQQFIGSKAIAERTQFDQIAYALQYCYETIGTKEYQWLSELARKCLPSYGTIFYFPFVEFPGTDDGMRTSSFGKRLQYDLLLQGVLKDFKVHYVTMPEGTIQYRAEFVEAYIGIYHSSPQK